MKNNELMDNIITVNKKGLELVSNTEYIEWMCDFSLIDPFFTDNEWYTYDRASLEYRNEISKLKLFFDQISLYADHHNIVPAKDEYNLHYTIKYKNYGFEIGSNIDYGIIYYCNRINLSSVKEYIDFEDIIKYHKQMKLLSFNKSLNKLASLINELYVSGVPLDQISEATTNTISNIYKDEQEEIFNKSR